MKIICGLGNPGRDYEGHRHNVGFQVVDALAAKLKVSFSSKFDAEVAQVTSAGERTLLIKPQTFMNLSGRSLGEAARFYKVDPLDVLVIHDELDLPFGTLQLKQGGGSGGHNGLNSIVEFWGQDSTARLRFGIGKPTGENAKERVVGHVLGDFSAEERAALPELVARAVSGAQAWMRDGMQKTMNAFNRRPKPPKPPEPA